MKSKAINKNLKQGIVNDVVKHSMKAKNEEWKAEEQAVADILYNKVVSAEVQKALAVVPVDYIHMYNHIKVELAGPGRVMLFFGKDRPLPKDSGYVCDLVLDKETPVELKLVEDYLKLKEAYIDARKKVRDAVEALLSTVKSTKQLYEVWPDIDQMLTEDVKKSLRSSIVANLPSVRLEDVKKVIAEMG